MILSRSATDKISLRRGSNDEKHVEALDINHLFLTKLFDNKLHFAPIDDNIQVCGILASNPPNQLKM